MGLNFKSFGHHEQKTSCKWYVTISPTVKLRLLDEDVSQK